MRTIILKQPNLGEVIAELRKKQGMSIRALAEITGVNKSTIVNIEKGRNAPTSDVLQRIFSALDVKLKIA